MSTALAELPWLDAAWHLTGHCMLRLVALPCTRPTSSFLHSQQQQLAMERPCSARPWAVMLFVQTEITLWTDQYQLQHVCAGNWLAAIAMLKRQTPAASLQPLP